MTDKELEHNAQKIKSLVETKLKQGNKLVLERLTRNVLPVSQGGRPESISRDNFWFVHIGCLLTSQQKSSHNDPVPRFLREEPFPLSYVICLEAYKSGSVAKMASNVLQKHPGIRFAVEKIPNAIEINLRFLERDRGIHWHRLLKFGEKLLEQREQTPKNSHYQLENEAADYLDERLKGFGSKQSRNFWQWLGLTRFVSVIDSRVQQWCIENLEGEWSEYDISRKGDYADMADLIRKACGKARVLPCMFDAAAFSEAETEPGSSLLCRGDKGDWDNL